LPGAPPVLCIRSLSPALQLVDRSFEIQHPLTSMARAMAHGYLQGMDEQAIQEIIGRLDFVLKDQPQGQPVAMGAALYNECLSRGLVTVDTEPRQGDPAFHGTVPIKLPRELPDWQFYIGPPHA
jgi:hypothetical protein